MYCNLIDSEYHIRIAIFINIINDLISFCSLDIWSRCQRVKQPRLLSRELKGKLMNRTSIQLLSKKIKPVLEISDLEPFEYTSLSLTS